VSDEETSPIALHIAPPDDFCVGLQEAINICDARADALEFALEEMALAGLDEYHLDLFQTRIDLVTELKASIQEAMAEHIQQQDQTN
jgi:hypothetical protein